MTRLLDIDEKIKEVEKERDMTETDFELLLDSFKDVINKGNKLDDGIIDIFKTYIKAIRDLNSELNYLFKYKGENKEK